MRYIVISNDSDIRCHAGIFKEKIAGDAEKEEETQQRNG
jgi:hypothetical protein